MVEGVEAEEIVTAGTTDPEVAEDFEAEHRPATVGVTTRLTIMASAVEGVEAEVSAVEVIPLLLMTGVMTREQNHKTLQVSFISYIVKLAKQVKLVDCLEKSNLYKTFIEDS